MTQIISAVEKELKMVVMKLDSYYVQIKLHHERKEYHKALEIFAIIGPLQHQAVQLQEKIKFYRKIEAMNQQGILVKRVKKVDETSMEMGR